MKLIVINKWHGVMNSCASLDDPIGHWLDSAPLLATRAAPVHGFGDKTTVVATVASRAVENLSLIHI